MSDKFTIEIITPDETILKSETTEVTIPSFEGQMSILKDHISLITFLRPGIIFVQNEEIKKYLPNYKNTIKLQNNKISIDYNKKKLLDNGDRWETALAENIKADSPFR